LNNTCKIGKIKLTNINKNLVGFIFHKFVRNVTHFFEKILQICVKLGKSCLVGLAPGVHSIKLFFLTSRFKDKISVQSKTVEKGTEILLDSN
jgi:uncharacterized protein YhhL (DUF1145 family)